MKTETKFYDNRYVAYDLEFLILPKNIKSRYVKTSEKTNRIIEAILIFCADNKNSLSLMEKIRNLATCSTKIKCYLEEGNFRLH